MKPDEPNPLPRLTPWRLAKVAALSLAFLACCALEAVVLGARRVFGV
jgi:hypothetical protein